MGTLIWVCCVFFNHFLYHNKTRDYSVVIVVGYTIAWSLLAIVVLSVHNNVASDPLWQAMGELMGNFKFWATFMVTIVLMFLPFVVHK